MEGLALLEKLRFGLALRRPYYVSYNQLHDFGRRKAFPREIRSERT